MSIQEGSKILLLPLSPSLSSSFWSAYPPASTVPFPFLCRPCPCRCVLPFHRTWGSEVPVPTPHPSCFPAFSLSLSWGGLWSSKGTQCPALPWAGFPGERLFIASLLKQFDSSLETPGCLSPVQTLLIQWVQHCTFQAKIY